MSREMLVFCDSGTKVFWHLWTKHVNLFLPFRSNFLASYKSRRHLVMAEYRMEEKASTKLESKIFTMYHNCIAMYRKNTNI